jgi:hypothetical protein
MLIFLVILGLGAALAYAAHSVAANLEAVGIGVCALVVALVVSSAVQVADQWDRAVILRLGKFHSLKGPGLFQSMQLGGLAGLTALTMGLGQERANGQKEAELKRET